MSWIMASEHKTNVRNCSGKMLNCQKKSFAQCVLTSGKGNASPINGHWFHLHLLIISSWRCFNSL